MKRPVSERVRGTYIGGHHAAGCIGESPFYTPSKVYSELITGERESDFVSVAMQDGLDHEQAALDALGLEITGRDEWHVSELDARLCGSVDAIAMIDGVEHVVEVTTCRTRNADKDRTYKLWQLQWYMWLAKIGRGVFAVYNIDTKTNVTQIVFADKVMQARLVSGSLAMLDAIDMGLPCPDVCDGVSDPVAIERLAYEYRAALQDEKSAGERKDTVRKQISLELGSVRKVLTPLVSVAYTKPTEKTKTDWERVARRLLEYAKTGAGASDELFDGLIAYSTTKTVSEPQLRITERVQK